MPRAVAEQRIPARMPAAVYDRIVEAAQTVGATLNQFLVQAALEKANTVLEEERVIKLSAAASAELFRIMENPPEPNDYLKRAMQRHKEIVCP